tara:strand:- start:2451 stop:4130 length:1680 start_codon:yes stop_codon:yes gene_type:complete
MKNQGIVIERIHSRNDIVHIYIRSSDDKVYFTSEHKYLVPFQRVEFEENTTYNKSIKLPHWLDDDTEIYGAYNVIGGQIEKEKSIIGGRLCLSSKTRWGVNSKGMKKYSFIPCCRSHYPTYCVASVKGPAQIDEYVRVEITPWNIDESTMPMGILVETLGKVTDESCYIKTLLSGYLLTMRSRNKIYKRYLPDYVTSSDCESLCIEDTWIDVPSYSIDPPGCIDIDDALSFNEDTQELAVHIASPDALGKSDLLDESIKHQTKTIYVSDSPLHLLPNSIVNEFSLFEGLVRPCLSVVFPKYESPRIIRTRIKVTKNLSYDDPPNADIEKLIGAIQDRFGFTNDTHELVERCMIQANCFVANTLIKQNTKGLLRVAKKGEKAWYKLGTSNDVHEYFDSLYTHFTSPLRRYSDQLVHQVLIKNRPIHLSDIHTLNRSQLMHSLFVSEVNIIQNISKEDASMTLRGVMVDVHNNYCRIKIEDGTILSIPLFRHSVIDYFDVTKNIEKNIAQISYFPDKSYYYEWELGKSTTCQISWNKMEGLQGILYNWTEPPIQNWIQSLI